MKKIKIVNYDVENTKGINSKIVLISDLHYHDKNNLISLNDIKDNILKIKPDYICIPGDFIDESKVIDEDLFIIWLDDLAHISKVIISLGNHDLRIKSDNNIYYNNVLFNKIRNIKNLKFLDNLEFLDNNINFIGLTLDFKCYHENKKGYECSLNSIKNSFNKKFDNNNYNILLAHSPYTVVNEVVFDELVNKNVDLILCGHTHGGISPSFIRKILFGRVLISPNKHLFVNYSYGYYNKKRTIVSSGVTKLSNVNMFRKFDFLTSSEIVIINLKSF